MANAILNFHFDYLNPSLTSMQWEIICKNLDNCETIWKMGSDLEKSGQFETVRKMGNDLASLKNPDSCETVRKNDLEKSRWL